MGCGASKKPARAIVSEEEAAVSRSRQSPAERYVPEPEQERNTETEPEPEETVPVPTSLSPEEPRLVELGLLDACAEGDTARLATLLAYDFDPNTADERGQTGLIEAARWGELQTLTLLLQCERTDANLPMDVGATALYIGAQNGHLPVVETLLAHPGIDPTCKVRGGGEAPRDSKRREIHNVERFSPAVFRTACDPVRAPLPARARGAAARIQPKPPPSSRPPPLLPTPARRHTHIRTECAMLAVS